MPPEQSPIDSLVNRGWRLVDITRHPLGSLKGRALGNYKLTVLLGEKNRVGATYFEIFLQTDAGEVSQEPLVIGLYGAGKYPSYNWIEVIKFEPHLRLNNGMEVSLNDELVQQVFQYLADLIPPGGHMMVEYDSPEQQDTARSLALGIPPVATPLGHLLFLVGCGAGFKDWHFAEGGAEGPRKLQGHKALDEGHARLKRDETARELTAFLERTQGTGSELERAARDRAVAILSQLRQGNSS